MLVKSFLAWMENAPVRERAEAVTMLAQAYLAGALGGDTPEAVQAALTLILDDPSPPVRRALAMIFADRPEAPRHIVLSLAADQSEVSALLIARSPLLTEADLVDLAENGDRLSLTAIALRQDVTARVARAIAERKDYDSACALAANRLAEIDEDDLLVLVEAFSERPRLRETLMRRTGLPGSVRHALMLAVAGSLGGYVTGGGFLSPARNARVVEETLQQGTVAIARRAGESLPDFIRHLRERGHLTPALLLRSGLGGNLALMKAALADLCEMEEGRVGGILGSRSEASIAALVRRAGIPGFVAPLLVAVIRAASMVPADQRGEDFSLVVLHAAQSACMSVPGDEGVRLMALLRRYEAEAARNHSRKIAEGLRREVLEARPEISLLPLDIGPELLRLTIAADTDPVPEAPEDPREPLVLQDVKPDEPVAILRRRPHGIILDEPIPDLRTLIAEWKAERAEQDRVAGQDRAQETVRAMTIESLRGHLNEKPGRSRAA
jgi:uncharacterized protein (DUF2336 family)